MKKVNQKMAMAIVIVTMLLSAQMNYGQAWTFSNATGNWIGYSDAVTTGIGIGNFGTGNISSALHVNTNLTATNSGFNAGEVFPSAGASLA